MTAKRKHYIIIDTEKARLPGRSRWRIEGPGLKPPIHLRNHDDAKVVCVALEQALEAGRGRPRDTLPPIGEKLPNDGEEDTDAGVGNLNTIPEM